MLPPAASRQIAAALTRCSALSAGGSITTADPDYLRIADAERAHDAKTR